MPSGTHPEAGGVALRAQRGAALTDRCVSVTLAGSAYGVAIGEVQEIIGARPLTRVFLAPPSVAGVTSLRGEILTVIDLARLLEVAAAAGAPDAPRIVVVCEATGARRRAGLLVDALGPVRELPGGLAGLDPAPATLPAKMRPYVRGVIRESPLCAVLDVTSLFDAPELAALAGRRPEGR